MKKIIRKIAELFGFRKEKKKEYVVIVGDVNKPWDKIAAVEPVFRGGIISGNPSPDSVE